MKKLFTISLALVLCWVCTFAAAQTTVKGKVTDASDGSAMVGVSIVVKGKLTGTTTDGDGNFTLSTNTPLPFTILLSSIGYTNQEVQVTQASQALDIKMQPSTTKLNELVVSASKVEESIMEAPVSIEKLSIKELRNTPSFDMYDAISNLKGVQVNNGSLTFSSINTRGFADMQNWRFIQLLDGMEMNAPGLNYPVGGNSGPPSVDILSIELVPGASSALYGANAFNGLLNITTKDPFNYQGFSAYVKGGVTSQEAGGTNPLLDFGARYAKAFNNKFAVKVTAGVMQGTDWTANDDSFYIDNTTATNATPEQIAALLQTPRSAPNYNAVNVYGDELSVPVNLGGGNTVNVNRTGIKEADIVNYDVQTYRFGASLHYRISEDLEVNYGFTYTQSDAILRHTTIYPLVNFDQQLHRLELKGTNFSLLGYYSVENARDSYAMLATGSFIEEGRKSSATWGADYGAAFRGEVTGVTAGDHAAARTYADRDLIPIGSDAFNQLRSATLDNPDISTGGSKFVDRTNFYNIVGNYDFTQFKDIVELQVGGNYRRFSLVSEGQLFNDGPLGFNAPIPIEEYGFFAQLGKKLLSDRLSLRASLRYDKNQNFDGRVTPRASAVFALDKKKKHNLRVSYQTGFRNPATQETYIALDIGGAILLGGTQDNINNYSYQVPNGGPLVQGPDIFNGLVTLPSFQAFLGGGGTDPSLLQLANLDILKQERNNTIEVGYKGLIADKLFIDLNYYYTEYEDFVTRLTTVSPQTGRVFLVYTNISNAKVTSAGVGLSLEYSLPGGYQLGGNYTYTQFDADEAVERNPGFLPSFNTPENRFNISLSNSSIGKTKFGFNLKYRWSQDYVWQSPFGKGDIPSFSVVDLALTYKFDKLKSSVKLGASNLLGQEYQTVYGGPMIGSIIYISWTYDQFLK